MQTSLFYQGLLNQLKCWSTLFSLNFCQTVKNYNWRKLTIVLWRPSSTLLICLYPPIDATIHFPCNWNLTHSNKYCCWYYKTNYENDFRKSVLLSDLDVHNEIRFVHGTCACPFYFLFLLTLMAWEAVPLELGQYARSVINKVQIIL